MSAFFSSFTTGPSTDRPAQDPLVGNSPAVSSDSVIERAHSPFAVVTVSGASMESPEPERSANWNGDLRLVALTPNTDHTLTVSASAMGGASEGSRQTPPARRSSSGAT